MTTRNRVRLLLLTTLAVALGSQTAWATTVHGSYSGTNYDYLGVQETSSFGDPEPLFGAPIIVGDSLVFTPTTFSASASGAFGSDQTGAQLQATIMSTGADPIKIIKIDEFGETDLSGIGTAATGAFISMSGVVTVLETTGGACVGPACQIGFVGTFTQDLFGLPADSGQTLFQGSVFVDVAALFPNATKVFLSFDNDMFAASESGTTAIIEKKPTIIVTVIPEPTTALLLGGGLIGLSLRSRFTRSTK